MAKEHPLQLNNGRLAKDPKTAVQMFLRTFETIFPLLEKYQNDTEKISKNIPILQEVAKETWKKEKQLKQFKSDLASLDRKIQLSLKPVKQTKGEDSEHKEENRNESQTTDNAAQRQDLRLPAARFSFHPSEKASPHLNQSPSVSASKIAWTR